MLVTKALTLSYLFLRISVKRPTIADTAIFMKRAVAFSHDAIVSRKGGSFGCVVVRHGKIIGEGYNAVSGNNGRTTHAEIVVIRTA